MRRASATAGDYRNGVVKNDATLWMRGEIAGPADTFMSFNKALQAVQHRLLNYGVMKSEFILKS